MDEGEDDEADAFNADDDVFVFFDSLDVACAAGEEASGDADVFVFPEILFVVYLAAGCVVGGKEPQQFD